MENIELKPFVLNPPINPTLITDGSGLEKLKSFFNNLKDKTIGWDKETSFCKDFFWRRDRTWQFGNTNEQYVIDLLAFVDGNSELLDSCQGHFGQRLSDKLKPVLDAVNPVICGNDFLKVGVNLGFEYEQSYWGFGQRTWNFYSCDMVERLIVAGAHTMKDYDYYSMEQLVARYFGFKIDKSLQQSFDLSTPLTQPQIDYAALDTRIPLGLRLKQLPIICKDKLEEVSKIENDAIGAFIDMHVHGQRIDREKWAARDAKMKEKLAQAITELDKYFIPIAGSKHEVMSEEDVAKMKEAWKAKTIVSDEELRLKGLLKKEKDASAKDAIKTSIIEIAAKRLEEKERLKAICSEASKKRTKVSNLAAECEGEALINYGSGAQVLAILKGIKGLGALEDTDDDTLVKFTKFPIINALRDYREYSKQVSTYGYAFYTEWITSPGADTEGGKEGWLHPGDGRIHPKFNQLEAETGRSSSSQPNGQNLPQDPELRSCFIADAPTRVSRCCKESVWVVQAGPNEDAELVYFSKCPKCNTLCVAELEEYVIVTADMSGAELRIIAELSGAKSWVDAFARDEDVHSVGTELMYPHKWPTLTVASLVHPDKWTMEDVKTELVPLFNEDGTPVLDKKGNQKKVPPCAYFACKDNGEHARQKCECPQHKKLRDGNKSTNFLLAYGGVAATLAERLGVPVTEAEEIMRLHEQANPEVWSYLDESGKQAKYTKQAHSMFGRRRQFLEPTWELAKEKVIEEAKGKIGNRWERAMRVPIPAPFKEFKEYSKHMAKNFELQNGRKPKKEELWAITHFPNPQAKYVSSMMKGMFERIERQGKNHCIQSTNADIAKLAMGCGYDTKEGKPFLWHILPKLKAKLLAFVHDELIVLAPKRLAEQVAFEIGDAFRRAAAEKMVKVIMKFDYHIASHWQK